VPTNADIAWSPDGSRIAFSRFVSRSDGSSGTTIFVIGSDGSGERALTSESEDADAPAWSPDGSRIAYGSNAGGTIDLWTMRADGSEKRRLTSTAHADIESTWSPDGRRIAFRRSSSPSSSEIMIIDADGGEPVSISGTSNGVNPSWSPDGRFIAFALIPDAGGHPQIYTIKPDGTERALRTTDYRWAGGRNPNWLRRR
jgi:Tol biopolymer transport system component